MKELSESARNALLALSVAAQNSASEIIGASFAAYYMDRHVGPQTLLHQLRLVKDHFAKLAPAVAALDGVIDELEGRPPVVPVDEQEAA